MASSNLSSSNLPHELIKAVDENPLLVSLVISCGSFWLCYRAIPRFKESFIRAGLFGIDMCKVSGEKIPESAGIICGTTFLVAMFIFIPFAFYRELISHDEFPFHQLVSYLSAMLAIGCMILLGFGDDVLDVRWRDKIFLPLIASLPLLMVYIVNIGMTTIVVPKPLRDWFGFHLNLGVFYYFYMGMVVVFCTHSINILAGINGLECGQSLVIAVSVILHNLIELTGAHGDFHEFSLYFMIPFTFVCSALLFHNWYPSKAFVGDTFCYFAGMTFACMGILGHFSKTLLLFFLPQIFNFVYSAPQLFHLVPCPRHRLPRYDPKRDALTMSTTEFRWSSLSLPSRFVLSVLRFFRLVHIEKKNCNPKNEGTIVMNNLTLINLVLKLCGPLHEELLTITLLGIQVVCSLLAFLIRYRLARLFYDE